MDIRDRCQAIRSSVTMSDVIEGWYGHELRRGRMACCFCDGTNPTKFRVIEDKGFKCAGCDASGDVISFVGRKEGLDKIEDAVKHIEEKLNLGQIEKPKDTKARTRRKADDLVEQARYEYVTEDGRLAYEIIRYWNNTRDKKECMPFKLGRYGLKSEDRILYNLNKVSNAIDEKIYIVEGEKCADAVTSLGLISTCNPFGSGEWKPEFGYSKHLEGKSVILFPDADDDGAKWVDLVTSDLRGKVKDLKVLALPKTWVKKNRQFRGHDVADYLEVEGEEKTKVLLEKAERRADVWIRGFEAGISVSPLEAYNKYLDLMDRGDFNVLDMSMWLPSMNIKARRGDLVCIMSGTGVGKTRVLMNMMYNISNVNYIIFDLELGCETIGERWAGLHNNVSVSQVQAAHALGHPYSLPDLKHIRIVPCGAKDMQFVRERIDAEEQMLGEEIGCVAIDYIGLMKGSGASKSETLSDIAEEFKGEMNNLGKVGIVSSQRLRPQDKDNGEFECPTLYDNKGSSSIENSAQEVIAIWKQRNASMLSAQCLKYTHGSLGDPVNLLVNELRISEFVPFDQVDREY